MAMIRYKSASFLSLSAEQFDSLKFNIEILLSYILSHQENLFMFYVFNDKEIQRQHLYYCHVSLTFSG